MEASISDVEESVNPPQEEVRIQLGRLLESDSFVSVEKRRKFLSYVVEETLQGRARSLKGVSIAMSVFERDADFDQMNDPVVRLEARRLRRDLDSYYAGAGRDDPIRITIPKGGYVPRFERQKAARQGGAELPVAAVESTPAAEVTDPIGLLARRWFLPGAVVIALIIAAAVAWRVFDSAPQQATTGLVLDDSFLALPKGPKIAVLPFQHLSGDPEKQYVTDGMTEQLTTELARFRDLLVLPLGTVQQYKTGLADPRELRREFGVD